MNNDTTTKISVQEMTQRFIGRLTDAIEPPPAPGSDGDIFGFGLDPLSDQAIADHVAGLCRDFLGMLGTLAASNNPAVAAHAIADGVYFLHSEGSAWIGAEFDSGRLISRTEQSNASTHAAARDHWHGIEPLDHDVEVAPDVAAAIVKIVMGDNIDPTLVVVTKIGG